MDIYNRYDEIKNSKRVRIDFWSDILEDRELGYWAERILTEIGYLLNIYTTEGREVPELLTAEMEKLHEAWTENGVISKQQALEAEKALFPLAETAKKYRLLFAAHAHIDMNWQWGMQETVGITIDTFQTMLDLMREYPDYIFSQSQASTYEIIAKYCPSLLPEIKQRVKEGRWEVTASTWVEPDKNLSGGEAMARHILYTKQYLSELLDIDPNSLELDFEPDTFGHSAFVPEIVTQGGIRYYYQCRGYDQEEVYRWRAPSGAEVLTFRDRNWYGGPVDYSTVLFVPDFCTKYKVSTALRVYGVGDHGGGPTRRDIERILDMKSWPLMPDIQFSRMVDFYKELEKSYDELPVVDHELNYIFTGCYTTQSKVKLANRVGEDRLFDSEALCSMAALCGGEKTYYQGFREAWKKVLFNQFHDILPGSGVPETQDYALGTMQEGLSYAQANANRAMKVIGDAADTSAFGMAVDAESTSEGAGPGYMSMRVPNNAEVFPDGYSFTQTGRSGGDVRAFTVFNSTQYDRTETVDLTLWDWNRSMKETVVVDAAGDSLTYDVLELDRGYWLHKYTKLAVTVSVPRFGFKTIFVRRSDVRRSVVPEPPIQPRFHTMQDGPIVLENTVIKAVFDSVTMKLLSLQEKKSGTELVCAQQPSGYFRLIHEDTGYGMSAWVIGAYSKITDLNASSDVHITKRKLDGVRKAITYEMKFQSSSLKVTVSLGENTGILRYSVVLDWRETGKPGDFVPQLQFFAPYAYASNRTRYDVPCGYVDREEMGHDVPAILYACPLPEKGGSALFMTSDCKYGYRTENGALSMTLVRSSFEPDLYPDQGIHSWELGLGVSENAEWNTLTRVATLFSHPLFPYSNSLHRGRLGTTHSFLSISGDVRVTGVKQGESDKSELVVRLCGSEEKTEAVISADRPAVTARLTDITESSALTLPIQGGAVSAEIPSFSLRTIAITVDGK